MIYSALSLKSSIIRQTGIFDRNPLIWGIGVEIAAVVFNRAGLGELRLESSTLVTKEGAEVLSKTPFKVDY